MAEQDKPTLVPSVLNDLMDVDGTAAEGDGLAYSDGAWRPGTAAGLLPANGPALTYFEANPVGSPTWANAVAIESAWVNADVSVAAGYEAYPGSQPVMGSWAGIAGGYNFLRWTADTPGLYSAYVYQSLSVNGAPDVSHSIMFADAQSIIESSTWGPDRLKTLFSSQVAGHTSRITMPISQSMIDAGVGGFDLKAPFYNTGGSERASAMYLFVILSRWSPGSTFDYYGEL